MHCACCGISLKVFRLAGSGVPPTSRKDRHYTSSLFSPNKQFTLCSSCYRNEEHLIEKEGTNDIPSLLATYTEE